MTVVTLLISKPSLRPLCKFTPAPPLPLLHTPAALLGPTCTPLNPFDITSAHVTHPGLVARDLRPIWSPGARCVGQTGRGGHTERERERGGDGPFDITDFDITETDSTNLI